MSKKPSKYRNLWIGLALLILLALLIYFYTYFFQKDSGKVIYQDAQRRIYLTERKAYGNKGREYWRMVYEELKTGNRFYVFGNSRKGFSVDKMAKIVLNTVDKSQKKSFDHVQSAGCMINQAKSDIHSNLNEKKGLKDFGIEIPDESEFMSAA